MDDTDKLPVVSFTELLMGRMDREIGRAFVINPEDMDPADEADGCTTFYVLDAEYRLFEMSIWDTKNIDTQRAVMEQALEDPARVALEPDVIARYGGRITDRSWFGDAAYTGVVFDSMIKLAEWAHVFKMENAVIFVGVPSLEGRVSVNIERRRA